MVKNLILILLVLTTGQQSLSGQGVIWKSDMNWERIRSLAQTENRPILIDFYTTWCRPCKVMDEKVFSDQEIGQRLNSHFINVKVNAEDIQNGVQLAKRYNIRAYPSIVYVDIDGTLLTKHEGQLSKYELTQLTNQVEDLRGAMLIVQSAKSNPKHKYDHNELRQLLSLTQIHTFPGKQHLTMRYMDGLQMIDEEDLRIIMDQAANVDLKYLGRLAPLTASLTYNDIYLRKNKRDWLSWKTKMEKAIYGHLEQYRLANDFSKYSETLEILRGFDGIKTRQIDELYLTYYKQNDLAQYKTFATYVIQEYVIPNRPEMVHEADRKKYAILQKEIKKDLAAAQSSSQSISVLDPHPTMGLDSLSEIYTISRRFADQLYDISSDFFALYEDDSSLRKASFWSALACKYYPYDWKYYDNHIYILQSIGKTKEAEEFHSYVRSLPFYSAMMAKSQMLMLGG